MRVPIIRCVRVDRHVAHRVFYRIFCRGGLCAVMIAVARLCGGHGDFPIQEPAINFVAYKAGVFS